MDNMASFGAPPVRQNAPRLARPLDTGVFHDDRYFDVFGE